jgi:F-box interacting protein
VFCNGSLHFVAEDGVITTFNVTDETFGTLMPPAGLEYSGFDLTELDGCLCAYFSSQLPTPASPYHIWLLRDYEGCCWEELRCFDWGTMTDAEFAALKSHWIAPLAMYPDGSTKIMFGTGSCKVFVVDPSNGGNPPVTLFSLELEDGVVPDDGQFATMGFFEESLVPVGRTSDEIILSSPSAQAWCQVLSRLPARTVGRLNQVCNDWRAIIKSECFVVDLHLEYQLANLSNKSPQIMFTDGKPNSFKPLENFIINTSQVPPLIDDSSRVVCSKPCHGLNAGAFMSYDFVCNPITGYYKALPLDDDDGELRPLHRPSEDNNHMFAGRLGLGYDVEIGMHVLVRITFKERNFTTRDYKLECEIRCIGDTMLWEELDPPHRPIADTPPAYSSGKIYWIADSKLLGQRSSGYEIIALDVATREFEILKGPPLRSHDDSIECVSIVELQGQICMVCSHPRFDSMEIWAMKGNGTWSMEYYIDLRRFTPEYSSELVTPIAIDPRDGRILLSTGRALGYYDPKTAEIETIYCLGKHISKDKKFVPILFQESLVSPCDQVYY